ncbi:TetR/AcrR family transcriptional regulator [Microlunatus soli]|uniref:TetR/AcrR family transcriptional regulator n=1 Tax=Microlunatus soli TaxID=630515 RepID=UPI0018D36BBB|nr:TetR/AcrR family transcriptional regulator [Microlunatus soli]
MTEDDIGLRERKKQATRVALRDAALRLALERGPDNVRVHDIAEASGVSPRTYNNYFSSREQAIVAAITADREQRIVTAIATRPDEISLSEAVISAIVEQYADPGDQARDVLLMITTSPALRESYADSVAISERPLADALIERAPDIDPLTARVLAAGVGAAARVAIHDWLTSVAVSASSTGFVVPAGSLAERMRAALLPLAPAFEAAVKRASLPH